MVSKCREYLTKYGTSVECYLELTPEININLGAAYSLNDKSWAFNIPEGNQLKLGIEGIVSAAFEAEVFFAEITLGVKGAITTAAGFELDQHENGLDLAGFHEGIMGSFEFVADVVFKDGGGKHIKTKDVYKHKEEWQLAAPLKACGSPLRINLYGTYRTMKKPAITPTNPVEPWAIESNQDWEFNTTRS